MLDDLFGASPSFALQSPSSSYKPVVVYHKNGLEIELVPSWSGDRSQCNVRIDARFRNRGSSDLSGVYMQVAVPKVSLPCVNMCRTAS